MAGKASHAATAAASLRGGGGRVAALNDQSRWQQQWTQACHHTRKVSLLREKRLTDTVSGAAGKDLAHHHPLGGVVYNDSFPWATDALQEGR